jgi:hypothetical protein
VLFFEDDMELMPPSRLSKLMTVVETAVASYHKCDVFVRFCISKKHVSLYSFVYEQDNALVKESFVRFFAHFMVGYREFVTLDDAAASHDEVIVCV